LVFPDLSYKIVGIAFKVFNNLRWGVSEKYYQRALAEELKLTRINFKREVLIPVDYLDKKIGHYFADFIIEDKILLELKIVARLGYIHARQVLLYLKQANIKLGILIYFTKNSVKYRRILNLGIKN
jgi:GxxExxY protein